MSSLAKNDIDWLEEHGFRWHGTMSSYKRNVGGKELSIYYSPTYGEGETAEEAFLDFLKKNRAQFEEMQSFLNELENI